MLRHNTLSGQPIAPAWHTVVLVLIQLAFAVAGSRLASTGSAGGNESAPRLQTYLFALLWEWGMLAYVLFGLHLRKSRLRDLIDGPALGIRTVLRDILVGLGFWVVWYLVERSAQLLLGANAGARFADSFFPVTGVEKAVFIVLAISSGICEEIIFRGYLLRQFFCWSGNLPIAVCLQAILFAVGHTYLGIKYVVLIILSGVLLALLAITSRSLRPVMVAHAWADICGAILIRGLPYK